MPVGSEALHINIETRQNATMSDVDYLTEWAHWRGEMTTRLSDVSRRIDALENSMDKIHLTLSEMREDQIRREAKESQQRSLLRWAFPEGGSVLALIVAGIAVIMQVLGK
jgi:seryl-tRNA synthetase